MKNNIKDGLEKLASDLFSIGEVDFTKDVYRIISRLPVEDKEPEVKKISSVKDIEEMKKDLSKIFSR
jgi:hypothetical protein